MGQEDAGLGIMHNRKEFHQSKKDPRKNKDTSWDRVANWYDSQVESAADYHVKLIFPNTLKLLLPKPGEKILDIGCGQGAFCRLMADCGANVTGIDASTKLITLANQRTPQKLKINYLVGDATRLDKIPDHYFDAAVSILAIQNMDPMAAVVGSAARVLKPGGKLLLVLNHPCFRIPRQSGWGVDEKRKLRYRRIDRYLSPLQIPIKMHPGAAPEIHTWTFHHPLGDYFSAFNQSGFAVTQLEEWASNRQSQPGKFAKPENQSREEIPLFLAIVAQKNS